MNVKGMFARFSFFWRKGKNTFSSSNESILLVRFLFYIYSVIRSKSYSRWCTFTLLYSAYACSVTSTQSFSVLFMNTYFILQCNSQRITSPRVPYCQKAMMHKYTCLRLTSVICDHMLEIELGQQKVVGSHGTTVYYVRRVPRQQLANYQSRRMDMVYYVIGYDTKQTTCQKSASVICYTMLFEPSCGICYSSERSSFLIKCLLLLNRVDKRKP